MTSTLYSLPIWDPGPCSPLPIPSFLISLALLEGRGLLGVTILSIAPHPPPSPCPTSGTAYLLSFFVYFLQGFPSPPRSFSRVCICWM